MNSFTDIYTGLPINPTEVAYNPITISVTTALTWPSVAVQGNYLAAGIMNVTATTTGLQLQMPNATQVSPGQSALVSNVGSNTFTLTDSGGNTIVSISAGQVYYIYLMNNSSSTGSWGVFLFAASAASVNASALAGAGLLAISSTLNINSPFTSVSSNYTLSTTDRGNTIMNTDGSYTYTAAPPSTLGNGWFVNIKNNGTGTITFTPSGAAIDGNSSLSITPGVSVIIASDGTNFHSLFQTTSTTTTYSRLVKSVAGSVNVTLTSAESAFSILSFTGTLTGNINIYAPTVVNEWIVENNTSGSYTATFTTSAGSGITLGPTSTSNIPQTTVNPCYCDGTNIRLSVNLSTTSSISSVIGGTGIGVSSTSSTATVFINNTTVGAGSYGAASSIPTFTVNSQGQLTAASSVSALMTTANIQTNAITNALLNVMPANTVKVNATSSAASPTDLSLSASTLLGMGSNGNIAAISPGTNLSFSGTMLNATGFTNGASVTSNGSNLVLTNSSVPYQVVTMTAAGLTVQLPDATTMSSAGSNLFLVKNAGTYSFTITDNAGQPRAIVGAGESFYVSLSSTGSAAGNWTCQNANQGGWTSTLVSMSNGLGQQLTGTTSPNIESIVPLTTSKALVLYFESGSPTTLRAGVVTISGETITMGTSVSVDTVTGLTGGISGCALSSTAVMCCYGGTSTVKSVVLSISGTTVTVNSSASVDTITPTNFYSFPLSSTAAFLGYAASSGNVKGVVLSVSGTTITVNTKVTGAQPTNNWWSMCQISTSAILLVYAGASSYLAAQLWTISGTTVTAQTALTNLSSSVALNAPPVACLTGTNNAVCAYQTASLNGLASFSVSGTTLATGAYYNNYYPTPLTSYPVCIFSTTNYLVIGTQTTPQVSSISTAIIFTTLKIDPVVYAISTASQSISPIPSPGTGLSNYPVPLGSGKFLTYYSNAAGTLTLVQVINAVY